MGVVLWVSLEKVKKDVLFQMDSGDTPSAIVIRARPPPNPTRAYFPASRRASASVSWYMRIQRRSIQSFSVHSHRPSALNRPQEATA